MAGQPSAAASARIIHVALVLGVVLVAVAVATVTAALFLKARIPARGRRHQR